MKKLIYILLIFTMPCYSQLTKVREIKGVLFYMIENDSLNIVENDFENPQRLNTVITTRNPNMLIFGSSDIKDIEEEIREIPFDYDETYLMILESVYPEYWIEKKLKELNEWEIIFNKIKDKEIAELIISNEKN